mgnify:CR=1 FL=1
MKEMMKKWAALYVQKITEHKGKERLYWIAAGPVCKCQALFYIVR